MSIPKIATYSLPGTWAEPRVQWTPDPRRAALLVHDMQDYFVNFYDRSAAPIPQVLGHIQALLDAAHIAEMPVFYTAQLPRQSAQDRGLLTEMWGPGLTAHPDQAALCADIAPQPGDTVLDKWRYSAFARSPLAQTLKDQGRDQLILCGVYAHIGCLMTACDAFMHDIQPFLVADAVADFSRQEHQMALDYVARRCGQVLATASVLAALDPPALQRPAAPAPDRPESLAALRQQVATLLDQPVNALKDDDNLLDWGLDSVRLMMLSERWEQAGLQASFAQLGEAPTLADWWRLIQPQLPPTPPQAHSLARIGLPDPARVLFKMCKHFALKVPVVFDEQHGDIQFEQGLGQLAHDGQTLTLRCQSPEPESLDTLEYILQEHLALMARDRTLSLAWTRG